MRSWVLKAKLITLTQPENFAFSSRRAAKPRNFRTAKLRCGWPDIVGDRLSAGMISDYCDFTMSSTFSATGQLLDVKRAGDRELARYEGGSVCWASQRCAAPTVSAIRAPWLPSGFG